MKTSLTNSGKKAKGYVLLIVLGLIAVALVMVANALSWSDSSATLTARNNEYFTTSYAAEAATEKALSSVSSDYQNFGEGLVYSKISTYAQGIPSLSDDPWWKDYRFSDGSGTTGQILVNRVNPNQNIVLGPPYEGLYALGATYQIIANAKNTASQYGVRAAVGQEVNLATIPIFQFAIFYQDDMEINPGAPMTISGLVHGNNNIYLQPQSPLTFNNDLSASGDVIRNSKPGDPTVRPAGSIQFNAYHLSDVNPLNLPVGTNTTSPVQSISDNVHAILEIPPRSEDPTSAAGQNRLYNKADMIITINNGQVTVTSGTDIDSAATVIPTNQWKLFLNTNDTFFNKREDLTVQAADLDVGKLKAWSQTNTLLRPVLGSRDVSSVYVADLRSTSNMVVVTNFLVQTNATVVTNTTPTTSLSYPATGTFVGQVNNTTIATNSPPPAPNSPPALNVVPVTVATNRSTAPAAGTYVGTVTTNGTVTTTASFPSPGTYMLPVTTNTNKGKVTGYTYKKITSYSYNQITSYSYSLPAYVYDKILGVGTNYSYVTNSFVSTNYAVFAESGLVITNGKTLPSLGLSVATPNPVYISGDFNTSVDGVNFYPGTSDTSHTRPAAIFADAINVLSTAWKPANSSLPVSSRNAANTTVNAALLAGIVPTQVDDGVGYYSGGVENYPRFLENWSGITFTYNGSMVVMFNSRFETAHWGGADVYNPPNRNWAFDKNFLDPRKLPPMTPRVITVNRSRWSLIAPDTTSF